MQLFTRNILENRQNKTNIIIVQLRVNDINCFKKYIIFFCVLNYFLSETSRGAGAQSVKSTVWGFDPHLRG